jgi:phage terminase large subunit
MSNAAIARLEADVGELLAAHEPAERIDCERYRGQPVLFTSEVLRRTLYPKQIEFLEALCRRKYIAVRGNHGAGKDFLIAVAALYLAFIEGKRVIVISASERQLLFQTWSELRRLFAPSELHGELRASTLLIDGEQCIIAMTSNSIDRLTGWHWPLGVAVLISEAQGEAVEATAYDSIMANTVDDRSQAVVAGNPIRNTGRFYELHSRALWFQIRFSAYDHPNVNEGREVIPGGPTPQWIEDVKLEFGADSDYFRSRVLGEFPTGAGFDALIRADWLAAAYARFTAPLQFALTPIPTAALDVARSLERDQSVAALAQGPRVLALEAWRSRDLVDTTNRFLDFVDRARAEWMHIFTGEPVTVRNGEALAECLRARSAPEFGLTVDAPGIGGGVIDIARNGRRRVGEHWGWSPALDQRRFANRRAEAYWFFRVILSNGTAILPHHPLLDEEARAVQWGLDNKGRIAIEPKDDLRARLNRSPDHLDACVIALAADMPGRNVSHFKPIY